MNRIHLHISVGDLPESIRFYSTLFGATPTVEKPDYAKWRLEDPRVNFAISTRGTKRGLDHLGIQSDSAEGLSEIESRLQDAGIDGALQKDTTCCYSRSDKVWIQDPEGIPWETFHTLGSAPMFNDTPNESPDGSSCCAPALSPCC